MGSLFFRFGLTLFCLTLAVLQIPAPIQSPTPVFADEPGFTLSASPSSGHAWTVEASGPLPVVYVGVLTDATTGQRFEGPAISKAGKNWKWIFSLPPVAARSVKIRFVARDPFSPSPPLDRPEIIYASGIFAAEAAKPEKSVDSAEQTESAGLAEPAGPLYDRVRGLKFSRYPRPEGDNGFGLHWFPTYMQSREEVDRFLPILEAMHIKWLLFLNNASDTGANQYLVKRLVEKKIMPIMRIYADIRNLPGSGGLAEYGRMVKFFTGLGVRYYQYLNEPNLSDEWGERSLPADSVKRFNDNWIPVARVILENGGIPGYPAPAFGYIDSSGRYGNGIDYFKSMLADLATRRGLMLLEKSVIVLHNYNTDRDPRELQKERFFEFRAYHEALLARGVDIPILGGEGGTRPEDVGGDLARMASWTKYCYEYMAAAEDYFFCFTPWLLTAPEGNGWVKHAWIKPDGSLLPVVGEIMKLSPASRKPAGEKGNLF